MRFQERLDDDRRKQAEVARAKAEAAEKAHEARLQEIKRACTAASALLREVDEAIEALRRDQVRSEAQLMSPPYRHDGPRAYRGGNILGPITGTVSHREKRRLLPGTVVRTETGFLGWWTRYMPFEFEVPVQGEPQASITWGAASTDPPMLLTQFVRSGVYEYVESHEFDSKVVAVSVDSGLRYLIYKIKEHLLQL
jgi:hypothetical protein